MGTLQSSDRRALQTRSRKCLESQGHSKRRKIRVTVSSAGMQQLKRQERTKEGREERGRKVGRREGGRERREGGERREEGGRRE